MWRKGSYVVYIYIYLSYVRDFIQSTLKQKMFSAKQTATVRMDLMKSQPLTIACPGLLLLKLDLNLVTKDLNHDAKTASYVSSIPLD